LPFRPGPPAPSFSPAKEKVNRINRQRKTLADCLGKSQDVQGLQIHTYVDTQNCFSDRIVGQNVAYFFSTKLSVKTWLTFVDQIVGQNVAYFFSIELSVKTWLTFVDQIVGQNVAYFCRPNCRSKRGLLLSTALSVKMWLTSFRSNCRSKRGFCFGDFSAVSVDLYFMS
jgi:hypothetical protein